MKMAPYNRVQTGRFYTIFRPVPYFVGCLNAGTYAWFSSLVFITYSATRRNVPHRNSVGTPASLADLRKKCNTVLHCVSKNAPTVASCSFDKHGLILIFWYFLVNSINTLWKMICIFNFLSLHFFLFYLLCDGKDAKQLVFLGWLLVDLSLKRAGCRVVLCVGSEKCRF